MAHPGHKGAAVLCFLCHSLLLAGSEGENFRSVLNESVDSVREKKSPDKQVQKASRVEPRTLLKMFGNENQISCSNNQIIYSITDVSSTRNVYERFSCCENIRHYLFRVPDSFGVVFTFHQIPLDKYNKLTVYKIAPNNQLPLMRVISLEKPDLSPLLVHSNAVSICVDIQNISVSAPVLNFSYAAHALADMPNEIDLISQIESVRESRHIYNCSRIQNIPHAIRCDMVRQCISGADETYCPYQTERCTNWIPYKNTSCLKIAFVQHTNYENFGNVLTAPLIAKRECKRKFKGVLAAVPDRIGLDLVERVLKASGYSSLAIGLYKYGTQDRFFQTVNSMYRFLWQWEGGLIAHDQIEIQITGARSDCAMLTLFPKRMFVPTPCQVYEKLPFPDGYLCQDVVKAPVDRSWNADINDKPVPRTSKSRTLLQSKVCADGSFSHPFLPCSAMDTGNPWSRQGFPLYKCCDEEHISYTLVCDGFLDCCDLSDEEKCANDILDQPPDTTDETASFPPSYFTCGNGQHVQRSQLCNGRLDCMDGSDEEECLQCAEETVFCNKLGCIPKTQAMYIGECHQNQTHPYYHSEGPGKLLVELDGWGFSTQRTVTKCPDTHIDCRDWMCVPYYLVMNGERDCLHGEDERGQNSLCRDLYRCHYSEICLHSDYVCDNIYHCPRGDDELYCNLSCPPDCSCEGYSLKCRRLFDTTMYPLARYLDLSGVLHQHEWRLDQLIFLNLLNLSNCMLQSTDLETMRLPHALETLDLSFNNLTVFDVNTILAELNVHYLNLSHNSLHRVAVSYLQLTTLDLSFNKLTNVNMIEICYRCRLRGLDLSHNRLFQTLDDSFSIHFPDVTKVYLGTLKLANTGITALGSRTFAHLENLRNLDISGNNIEMVVNDAFDGLSNLLHLQTDLSKLCCEYFHKKTIYCFSTLDDISSCSDLLLSDFFRTFLWGISIIAIGGNVGVLIYRLVYNTVETSPVYRILVCNLCVADMITGIYLLIIGVVDAIYRGVYVSYDFEWKRSALCQAAGFMALMSAEASALLICIITADRAIVLQFPYNTSFHLAERPIVLICALTWALSVFLAAVPLWPQNDHWRFYSHTSICLPILILQHAFTGKKFAVGVFIIANFFHFIFIGVGQLVIFKLVRTSTAATRSRAQFCSKEVRITQRLLLIIFCHFCCWIPIVVMGLLIAQGIFIYDEVFVWVLVFVFPFNSALNPFLYTIILLLEKRREEEENRQVQKVLVNLKDEVKNWRKDKIMEFFDYLSQSELISRRSSETMLQTTNSQEDSPGETRV